MSLERATSWWKFEFFISLGTDSIPSSLRCVIEKLRLTSFRGNFRICVEVWKHSPCFTTGLRLEENWESTSTVECLIIDFLLWVCCDIEMLITMRTVVPFIKYWKINKRFCKNVLARNLHSQISDYNSLNSRLLETTFTSPSVSMHTEGTKILRWWVRAWTVPNFKLECCSAGIHSRKTSFSASVNSEIQMELDKFDLF